MDLSHWPWWLKLALSFVSVGALLLKFGKAGIAKLLAWAMPLVVLGVDMFFDWVHVHPAMQAALVKYAPEIKELLDGLLDAINKLIDAAQAEADKRIDGEKDAPPTAPPTGADVPTK